MGSQSVLKSLEGGGRKIVLFFSLFVKLELRVFFILLFFCDFQSHNQTTITAQQSPRATKASGRKEDRGTVAEEQTKNRKRESKREGECRSSSSC